MDVSLLRNLFGVDHPVVAMAHFPPLPGTPLHDDAGGMAALLDAVARDVTILEEAGFDAVLFCNEGDRPYAFEVGPEIAAAMAWIIARAAPRKIPFGVDHLYDIRTAIAVGRATGAAFVRGVFSGAYESDMGVWNPGLPGLLRYRRMIGGGAMKLFIADRTDGIGRSRRPDQFVRTRTAHAATRRGRIRPALVAPEETDMASDACPRFRPRQHGHVACPRL